MKYKNSKVTWTDLELSGLLEDEECHVHFMRINKHLALHPYHLNNVQQGINQILRSSLNSYDREFKGFVLAFRSPKLLSNLGEMLYDSPFIHIDVEADFYVFRPTIGSFLKGIVKKKGLDHIVVLVHKVYTVSIPKPEDTEEWAGELVEIGQEVKCYVNQIDNKSRPPFICATLRSNYSQDCRLSESNIDNVDSAIESMNNTMRLDVSNEVLEDNVSEKERKKHRKKHKKSRENDSSLTCKVENKSETNDNLGNDISRIIKSERKDQYQSIQDTILNTDVSLNNLEVNISKKHKRSRKTSETLLSDNTILDEHTVSCKAMKRENSIPLDNVIETETKKRKKHAKKSREFDSENEEKVINNAEKPISKYIKSQEEQHTHKKHILNADFSSNNLKDSVPKKHKKNKKISMKMSDSDSESHIVKIKIEKQDPFLDRIIDENKALSSKIQIVQSSNKNLKMPEFVKKEVSIEYDTLEEERKKNPKKHTIRDPQSKSIKIKIEDVSDVSDKEGKKSSKKHASVSRDSDSKIKIKSENITNNVCVNDIKRAIKFDSDESQHIKYNKSAIDSSLNDSDFNHVPKKSKKKTSTISDSELKYPIKIKTEPV